MYLRRFINSLSSGISSWNTVSGYLCIECQHCTTRSSPEICSIGFHALRSSSASDGVAISLRQVSAVNYVSQMLHK